MRGVARWAGSKFSIPYGLHVRSTLQRNLICVLASACIFYYWRLMISKSPLPTCEQIRRLKYCEDGEWDLDRLDVEFARLRSRLGEDNPHFQDAYSTFEYCRKQVKIVLSQLKEDYERIWERAEAVRKDFHDFLNQEGSPLLSSGNPNNIDVLRNALGRFDMQLEYLAGDFLAFTEPFFAKRAVAAMQMACLRFMCIAIPAEWPKSTGRRLTAAESDPKPKIQYVEEAFLAEPSAKVAVIESVAEQAFHKKNPGKPFLSSEHIERYVRKRRRSHNAH